MPLHFTAFHPDYKMTDVAGHAAGDADARARIALANGLHYVYTGNVHDAEGGTTFCPGCAAPLIERDWYAVLHYRLDAQGGCPAAARASPATSRRASNAASAAGASRCGCRQDSCDIEGLATAQAQAMP